ncbi:hypothetical protein AVEN_235388-1 [Araneus ventricosus]|uniref:Mariner Mos1 transposase n=1 Tax=Araneus ventricosus TaxID=182803 RepID=A0A4Y2A4Z6_ARAVE|nr:hypothetical protein AVEN_235388-1 [Araneus ventricosus]
MRWKPPSSPVTKKFQVLHSAGKVVLTVFWDPKGFILIDFFTSRTINAARYYDTLTKLMSTIRRKRPGLLSRGVLFLDDNAIAGRRFLPGWFLEIDFTKSSQIWPPFLLFARGKCLIIMQRKGESQWLSGKAPDLGAGGPRFETRLHQNSALYMDLAHTQSGVVDQKSSPWCGAEA